MAKFKVTVAKRNGEEEIHRPGCADLKKTRRRGQVVYGSDRDDWTLEIDTLRDLYASYWDCIAEEAVGNGDYETVEQAWWAWRGEFNVLPCAGNIPEMDEPGTEPAKVTRQEAKNDLARRLVLAAEEMVKGLDGTDLALGAMSKDEAAQFVANWLHSLPTGGRDGERWWGTSLPRPATADWKK